MRRLFLGLVLCLAGCGSTEKTESTPKLTYTLTRIFTDAEKQLKVQVNFIGDIDGETSIRVGSRWGRDEKAGKRFRNLSVSGRDAELPQDINKPIVSVRHAPSAELTITYTLSSEDMDDAAADIEYFYVPVILPDVIHLIGASSLIIPRWDDPDESFDVEIKWAGLPEGWAQADTLPDRAIYPREIGSQLLVAAPSKNISIVGETYELTILKVGEHDFSTDAFQTEMVKVYDGLNTLWQADEPKFLVTLLGTPDYSTYQSFTGTGRFNSFASAASRGIELDFLVRFLGHEVAHHWMPGKLGDWPSCSEGENCPPRISWFSEGFTDFVMTRVMLSQGYWTEDDLLAFTNQYLRNYYLSPAKTAQAHTIDDLFWEDYEYEKQPYWRGFLLAMNWNSEIKEQTNSQSNVMDILREMYETAKVAPENETPALTSDYISQNFSAKAGRNLQNDLDKFYYKGEVLKPHPNMFPGFATLKSMPIYVYDIGFDIEATLSSGIVSGVIQSHNAFKAGLKDGQVFVNKVSGGGGDTTIPLVLEVNEEGTQLAISYLPLSGDPVRIPQFEKK